MFEMFKDQDLSGTLKLYVFYQISQIYLREWPMSTFMREERKASLLHLAWRPRTRGAVFGNSPWDFSVWKYIWIYLSDSAVKPFQTELVCGAGHWLYISRINLVSRVTEMTNTSTCMISPTCSWQCCNSWWNFRERDTATNSYVANRLPAPYLERVSHTVTISYVANRLPESNCPAPSPDRTGSRLTSKDWSQ